MNGLNSRMFSDGPEQSLENLKIPAGVKYDSDKDRWDLLPIAPVREIVKVLTFGARKYEPNNWMYVSNCKDRYYAAALRHITSWFEGQKYDEETNLHHLAHACCCLLFAMWHDWKDENEENTDKSSQTNRE